MERMRGTAVSGQRHGVATCRVVVDVNSPAEAWFTCEVKFRTVRAGVSHKHATRAGVGRAASPHHTHTLQGWLEGFWLAWSLHA